jgi:aspartyl-tRNA(Asn)/glutamyl-tRNA(Gln) amidotransferase subunit A
VGRGRDGPLGGIPVAVKDLFCTEGVQTTAGSRILEGHRPLYTATAVRRLAEAGAAVLGKTNMDEFAMGSSNENSAYGPVLNPRDRQRVPGGSSGGSAAVVAGGLAPCAIGTDTGGSIRQPAALCGIVGLKPTYGAISRYGMIAFASSLDQCGPLTRDVTDAALLLEAMQGRDPCDSTSVGIEGGVRAPSREDLKGLRFAVPAELAHDAIESGVREVFEATLARIEELGGEIAEVPLPHAEHGISAYYVIAPAEASSNLARYDGVRYGLRVETEGDVVEMYEATRVAASATRSSAASCSAPTRSRRATTRPTTAGRSGSAPGSPRTSPPPSSASTSSSRRPRPRSPSARREDRRPAGDVHERLLHRADEPRRHPGDLDPGRAGRADGGGPRLPVGFQIAAPAFAEQKLLERLALEGVGFDAAIDG